MKQPPLLKLCTLAAALLCCPGAATRAQQTNPSPSAQALLKNLETEFSQLQEKAVTAYMAASEEERKALPDVNLWPREQILPKLAQAAKRFAGTPDAVVFHLWIIENSLRLPSPAMAMTSIDLLLQDHIQDDRLSKLAAWLPHLRNAYGVAGTSSRLDRLRKGARKRSVQAACMLAQASLRTGNRDERIKRLRHVVEFAPETASGRRAKRSIYELEHLQVGCSAPDIDGIDLDGVPLRLSDYRSKIVLLGFWGDW